MTAIPGGWELLRADSALITQILDHGPNFGQDTPIHALYLLLRGASLRL